MAKQTRSQQKRDPRLEQKPLHKEKYVKETVNGLTQFKPTEKQRQMLDVIRYNTLSVVEAPAGTGKTSTVLWDYCQEYLRDPTKKIVVVRTPVEAASLDKVGFLPNSLQEKCAPHFESTKRILEEFSGKNKVECDMDQRIFFKIPNYMVGSTIDNALILIDEGQLMQPMIMKLILERLGLNSRCSVVGDASQIYANEREAKLRNGLSDMIYRFFDDDMKPLYPDVGYFSFDVEDVQRSEIVKTVISAYRK